jgi:RHH-type proline utilization regulon transcriptional repressor/proline dehydrogenase/delta 1-pyrroline-5-carboxylate dehydrogenase
MRFLANDPPPQAPSVGNAHLAELRAQIQQVAAHQSGAPFDAETATRLSTAIASYELYYSDEFGRTHDHFRLIGQDNIRRYLPVQQLRIRVHPEDTPFDVVARVCAAQAVGSRPTVSSPVGRPTPVVQWLDEVTATWGGAIEFVEESDEELADIIRQEDTQRIRYAAPDRVPISIRRAAAEAGLYLADAAVLTHGRIELLWYVEEQSISNNYHRYGNLGARAEEQRRDTL